MKKIKNGIFKGERALFNSNGLDIENSIFCDGESPLKESSNILLNNCTFKWKYPLWYCKEIKLYNSKLLDSARSGIWYTKNIEIKDTIIEAPKTFRRSEEIKLINVSMPNALESLWNCNNVLLENVKINGDYFGMNCQNIKANKFHIDGNYVFDGAKDIVIKDSYLNSKDSFWNCENVVVTNSTIIGEYLGWNSKNLTFIDCTIESLQGMCYIENIKMINCKLINTTLAFEYSSIDCEISSSIDSIKNPYSGRIKAKKIDEVILEDKYIDKDKVIVEVD